MRPFDVLIIGAGIVGCACACECAAAGLRVGVLERDVVGGGATAAGMGHVVVMDDSPAQLALTAYSRTLWRELINELPVSVEYESRGTLWVAADEDEMREVRAKYTLYAQTGVESEILDGRSLEEAEPYLRNGLPGALLVPQDAVIYPPAAAAYFLTRAQQLGATLLRGEAVRIGAGFVRLRDGSELKTGRILVANGADTGLLPWLPIQKRKGHLLITERYPGMVRHQLVELGYLKSAHSITADSVAFNVQPRKTGQLLIGSSRQFGDESKAVQQKLLERMLLRAQEYLPALRNVLGIRVWTGFRAATPDKLPLIGPTEDPSVFLAVGFEGLGITNAPGAARLAVNALLERASAIDPAPYMPARVATAHPEAIHA